MTRQVAGDSKPNPAGVLASGAARGIQVTPEIPAALPGGACEAAEPRRPQRALAVGSVVALHGQKHHPTEAKWARLVVFSELGLRRCLSLVPLTFWCHVGTCS